MRSGDIVIEKKSIFVISAGRTGTAFFAELFGKIIRGCDSFHEPDVFKRLAFRAVGSHLAAMKHFGPYRYTFGKALGKGSTRAQTARASTVT